MRNGNSGQNTFVLSEDKENESLDIYEWHKVYGALFNLEETANTNFEEAEARYQCNTDNAAFIAEERLLESTQPISNPKVMWAYHSTYNNELYWDVVSCDKKNLYFCEFAQRCQATLLHSNSGSIPNTWLDGDYHMTDEEFFAFAKDADHWIYIGSNWVETYETFKANLTEFKSVQVCTNYAI